MKVTYQWLKEYVDFSWNADELAQRLTMLGVEVEKIEKLGGELDGVVVAQILASDKHPNADKLSVCRVADGRGERQIVCGATNYKVGDKVPLALPGATLPTAPGLAPFTIKVSKMRGVESQGMMCSGRELALAEDAAGLLILPADAQVGQPLAQHLGRPVSDVLYDFEITPNRPDLNSVIGLAREIAALTGNPLRIPSLKLQEDSSMRAEELVTIHLEAPDLCPRYTARLVRGIKIGPSPAWLKQCLEKVGQRSINNVVDATNYVMLESGQPLHAFDYRLLARPRDGLPTIRVRRATEGETLTTLDGQIRKLSARMLLIADHEKGIALAGVMGGQNTEISELTTDVLIESACFNPQNIRATSKGLDLRSDASYRFERGSDIGITEWAANRAAQLITELAGGKAVAGTVDAYSNPPAKRHIKLRHAKTNALLGVTIAPEEQRNLLERLELVGEAESDAVTSFVPPSWRVDLKSEIDLVEEIARLYGIDRIPATQPRGAIGVNAFDPTHDKIAEARRLLSGLGLNEVQGQTLIAESVAKLCGQQPIRLENPLSAEMGVLRPSLLPGLLEMLRHNLSHKNEDLALFEIGRVFLENGNESREERRVAVALTGQRSPAFWTGAERNARFDSYDLKGVLEEFFEHFGVRGLSYQRRETRVDLFVEAASVLLGKQSLGEMGHVSPPLARRYNLRDAVFLAELNLDAILARRSPARNFKPLPPFPTIRRDVAMLVDESVEHEMVLGTVRKLKPAHLEKTELFDVFRGKNVAPGQKSVAYAFTYRSAEKTLTDAEVNAAHQTVLETLRRELKAVIRDS